VTLRSSALLIAKRSAEAATGIAGRQLAQGQTAHPKQQLHGLVADPQSQHRMACGVISDRLQSLIDRVCQLRWHTLGTTGVVSWSPLGAPQITERHKHWWARTVSNRRPLVCKGPGKSEQAFYRVQYVQVSAVARVRLDAAVSTVFGPVLGHWRATGERVFG
jgi:hypothetical protein